MSILGVIVRAFPAAAREAQAALCRLPGLDIAAAVGGRFVVVIEDSVPGVRAAASAGMAVIGFCGGSHCPAGHGDMLRRNGATAAIADFRDLPPSVAALPL